MTARTCRSSLSPAPPAAATSVRAGAGVAGKRRLGRRPAPFRDRRASRAAAVRAPSLPAARAAAAGRTERAAPAASLAVPSAQTSTARRKSIDQAVRSVERIDRVAADTPSRSTTSRVVFCGCRPSLTSFTTSSSNFSAASCSAGAALTPLRSKNSASRIGDLFLVVGDSASRSTVSRMPSGSTVRLMSFKVASALSTGWSLRRPTGVGDAAGAASRRGSRGESRAGERFVAAARACWTDTPAPAA